MTVDAMDVSNGDAAPEHPIKKLAEPERVGGKRLIDKSEYIRLIQQSLTKMGYGDCAKKLEADAGIEMQPQSATAFQSRILSGEWDSALSLLPQLTNNEEILRDAKFLILQQQYLEALEQNDLAAALTCLRQELAPLNARLPQALIIPDGQLEQLEEQALTAQDKTVIIWSIDEAVPMQPSKPSSSNSTINLPPLSSSQARSKPKFIPLHTLHGHDKPVASVSWSPDDSKLLTCSDETLRLYDAISGQMMHVFRRFLSGSVDKSIIMSDVNGEELQKWKRPYRVQDMVVTHNGSCIIIACSDRKVHILRLSDQKGVTFQESSPITSITLSADSRYLLVNLQSHTVHLWDLGNIAQKYPLAMDVGPDPMDIVPTSHLVEYRVNEGKQGRFVLRSSFGGNSGSFVVYIWHRDSGELLLKLDGHTGTVNSVSWNADNPFLLASAADDGTSGCSSLIEKRAVARFCRKVLLALGATASGPQYTLDRKRHRAGELIAPFLPVGCSNLIKKSSG
eukprot:gene15759-21882_t